MNDAALIQSPQGRAARGAFSGERDDFFRLVRRGALLELITAGFYRFWLATDIRRALWSGTVLEDDPAEYTGTAKELLIGFLFALAILVPIYLIYFLIGMRPSAPRRSRACLWSCSSTLSDNSRFSARGATAPPARSGAACVFG